jgi:hypothetical protein
MNLDGPFTNISALLSRCDVVISYIKSSSVYSNLISFSVPPIPLRLLILVLGYEIQSLVIIISVTDAEFGVTIAAIPFTIAVLFFCAWSVRREFVGGMVATIFCFFGGLAYFLFKVSHPSCKHADGSLCECINLHKLGNIFLHDAP